MPFGGHDHALRPPVGGIGLALDEATRLEPIDQAAERDLADVHDLGKLRLHHSLAVVAGEVGEHPPLRTRHAHRAKRVVHHRAAQPGYVMDQEADPERVFFLCHDGHLR